MAFDYQALLSTPGHPTPRLKESLVFASGRPASQGSPNDGNARFSDDDPPFIQPVSLLSQHVIPFSKGFAPL